MKLLDVAGTGIKAAVAAAAAMLPKAKSAPVSPEAREEMRRRAAVNARAEAARRDREAMLFGSSRWLGRRPDWLERGR